MPSGTTPSRTKRHKAISSLPAKATIIFLREPRAFAVRARNHLAKASRESATRAGSALGAPVHCRRGQALSRGVSVRFRRATP
jgi:hypothetical protein